MLAGFISSLTVNIILFILFLILLILYLSYNPIVVASPGIPNICPAPPASKNNLPQPNVAYTMKTLTGNYVQSCFGCLASPVSCFQKGMVASQDWNGDKVELIPQGGDSYQMIVRRSDISGNQKPLYFIMVSSGPTYLLCLTEIPNQRGTTFEIIPYINNKGENVYQIGILETNSLLGESDRSCLVSQGISLESGFNITPNAPRGMDARSFFMFL
jgi:hypothetical protein